MLSEFLRKRTQALALIVIALGLNACQGPHWFWLSLSSRAQAPNLSSPITVATVYGNLTAKTQYHWQSGFEFDLLQSFTQAEGRHLKVLYFKTPKAAIKAVLEGKAQVLATRLTQEVPHLFRSSTYQETANQSYAFAFSTKSLNLRKQYNRWFIHASRAGKINEIRARYFSYSDELAEIDYHFFKKHIFSRLPEHKTHFRSFGREFKIPWTWLAAVSYQESKWDDEAVSFTGVRGLMQVTWDTADTLGIEDRHDPVQSVFAGAKYLNQLMKRMPKSLPDREKFIFALISYNVGVAHMMDAQKLATEFSLNPWAWSSLEKTLPLLSQEKYYSRLKYGQARGEEPVQFVRRVLSYLDYLETK